MGWQDGLWCELWQCVRPGPPNWVAFLDYCADMAASRAVARALWGGECRGGGEGYECTGMRGALAARSEQRL